MKEQEEVQMWRTDTEEQIEKEGMKIKLEVKVDIGQSNSSRIMLPSILCCSFNFLTMQ